jgi:hypothetical protein
MICRYLWASRRTPRHLLYIASAASVLVLFGELWRTTLILLGVWAPMSKYFWMTLAEHIPFGLVGYEITKNSSNYIPLRPIPC